ncbi:response regulator transcription factor [Fulvivirgaceae bacterium BMA12]|uniref:Response regulator transcription factor n=1 Tax=Agaribacillus aureus TaxID=3051825 RepID=A0ABT8L4X5_9BACT|nr:response regulator transcription factor [Fulvivirgaceae bacterium BMA12]
MGVIKVMIADDHQLFRTGMVAVLRDIGGIAVIDQAENGQELLEKLVNKQPDVILMDIKMPEMDGIETTEVVISKYPGVRVIMLTMHDDEHFITHMVDLGAHGYLLKNADVQELELAINKVMEQGYYFNYKVSETLLSGLVGRKSKRNQKKKNELHFSKREQEVLQLICDGFTNSQIAEKLFLSIRTVEGYRYKLCDKVGVKNTAGLVRYAIKNRLVE